MAKAATFQPDMVYLMERIDLADGRKRLYDALRGLDRTGLKRIADVVADEAKQIVAIDTGTLRDSIKGRVRKRRGAGELMASVSTNTKDKGYRKIPVGGGRMKRVGFGYGLLQEIGRHDGKSYSYRPYLRPGLLASWNEIKRILVEEYARMAQASKAAAPVSAGYVNVAIPVLDREIHVGAKGGKYYLNDSGKRTYVK